MNFKVMCQWLLVITLVIRFFVMLYRDFNGIGAEKPAGFTGFVETLIAIAVSAALFHGAGAFDSLLFLVE